MRKVVSVKAWGEVVVRSKLIVNSKQLLQTPSAKGNRRSSEVCLAQRNAKQQSEKIAARVSFNAVISCYRENF